MSKKARRVALCLLLALWGGWVFYSSRLRVRAFMREDAPDAAVIATVTVLIALFCAWRRWRSGNASPFHALAPWKIFLCVLAFVGTTLWAIPEAWVQLTAKETVRSEIIFRLTYPGPSSGRNHHCEAGLRVDDAWLHRLVEICTHTHKVPSDASTVQIEKRIAARGAVFVRYRFVSAAGIPYGWEYL
ncbi:hypothetical protein ACUY4R_002972 [Kosakonia sp. BK9b]